MKLHSFTLQSKSCNFHSYSMKTPILQGPTACSSLAISANILQFLLAVCWQTKHES